MNKCRYAKIMLLALVLSVVGCGLSSENLIPDTTNLGATTIEKVIKVVDVQGAQESFFGGPAMITDEEYKEALVNSLGKSKLFREVRTDGDSDLDLYAKIIVHGQADDAVGSIGVLEFIADYTSAMVVEYRIIETKTGEEIWKKGFSSRHKVTVAQELGGAARTIKAQEGSVKKNLSQFLRSLSELKLN